MKRTQDLKKRDQEPFCVCNHLRYCSQGMNKAAANPFLVVSFYKCFMNEYAISLLETGF